VTAAAARVVPRTTLGAPRADLEEHLQRLRRALAERDETPTGAWVEESAAELAAGSKTGWYLPEPGGGISFYARRGPAAYGHVHCETGPEVAGLLAEALLDHLPEEVATLDLGFTGLSGPDERALAERLARRAGSTVIERAAMERTLSDADRHFPAEPPAGIDRLPVSAVTLEALTDLDRAAFRGSTDALLLGEEPGAYRRALEAMLESRLGRFLGEASAALVEPEPTRLVGAVLTSERSSRRAVVLELVVDPERRGQGLGRFLLGWTLRAVWALGYEHVRLWVSVGNESAIGLYRAFGFRRVLEATIYRWERPTGPQAQVAR